MRTTWLDGTEFEGQIFTFHGKACQKNLRHVENREYCIQESVFFGFLAKWVDAQRNLQTKPNQYALLCHEHRINVAAYNI
jgi:hypothetical protein